MAKGNVELWLVELLSQQQKSLHGIIRDAFRTTTSSDFELLGFLNSAAAQVMWSWFWFRIITCVDR
jgi:dynein heavy chain